ncbi:unnamed protein product [Urochloa humidicola]
MAREQGRAARDMEFGGGGKRRFEEERPGGRFHQERPRSGRGEDDLRREFQLRDQALRTKAPNHNGPRNFRDEDYVAKKRFGEGRGFDQAGAWRRGKRSI